MALDAEAELARNRIDPRYRADAERRGKLTSVFALSGNDYELLSQALASNTAPDKDTAIVLSASQQSRRHAEITRSEKREERQRVQLTIAEQARQLSERLAREIAAMEAAFESEYGDAWREHIANWVMDPDEIPQRRPGESMQDYRERLESVLITSMIESDGSIRSEYANSDDPDVRRYAEWAQAQHAKREADAYLAQRSDPRLSHFDRERLDEEYAQRSNVEQLYNADRSMTESSQTLTTAIDEQRIEEGKNANGAAELSAFDL